MKLDLCHGAAAAVFGFGETDHMLFYGTRGALRSLQPKKEMQPQNNSQSMHLTLPPPSRSMVLMSTTRGEEAAGSGNREESWDGWEEEEEEEEVVN